MTGLLTKSRRFFETLAQPAFQKIGAKIKSAAKRSLRERFAAL
jgi:hypothetical protein